MRIEKRFVVFISRHDNEIGEDILIQFRFASCENCFRTEEDAANALAEDKFAMAIAFHSQFFILPETQIKND